jgi:hypothetical protein
MPIGSVIEGGLLICVYDEDGRTLFQMARGSGATDGLLGFTGSTVTARCGSIIYTYDETGTTIYAKAAKPLSRAKGSRLFDGLLHRSAHLLPQLLKRVPSSVSR